MPVNTITAAAYIAPVALKTLLKHSRKRGHKLQAGDHTEEATDDIFFDEAFHIVKAFIELGTLNTIESLQTFTNTHVPAPFWAAVSPVHIPLSSCNKAADVLIDWFGPEDLKHVVGGDKWWQVRGLDGIESEWVTEKRFMKNGQHHDHQKLTEAEKGILRMEHLDTVLFYVHGGAYFWGSINTHRYQIIRYARKIKGRAFAVNYRKAPQYPWPCPLQDVLAAYFYLIDPPSGALHKPVPPSKLVLAGDSAGAGLCITVLTVLRDLGLPQPAGAVLISPWVDLTHSFPSVMKNTMTDIIPPHGFIHKPSTLWPVQARPEGGRARVIPTGTNPPPKPGHADTLRPSSDRLADQVEERLEASNERDEEVHAADLTENPSAINSQQEMLAENSDKSPSGSKGRAGCMNKNLPARNSKTQFEDGGADPGDAALDFWEPKPPKVLMDDPKEKPLELRSQIQIYATTEQLTHPLVSPVLQGSLGNLCPLYIIAGDSEVLRDEIIYLAHKAAHPKDYPAREGVLKEGRRQRENADKFQTPTKVHLQVFDGMCHVLTVFTFTQSAKYAYNSIAQFVKHVTSYSQEHLDRNPFPELHRPSMEISDSDSEDGYHYDQPSRGSTHKNGEQMLKETGLRQSSPSGVEHYRANEEKTIQEAKTGEAERMPGVENNDNNSNDIAEAKGDGASSGTSDKDIPHIFMIRERVDVCGRVRSMEPKEEIDALRLRPQEIGVIKEAPVKRWLSGQELWDKKYRRVAQKAVLERRRYEAKATRLLKNAQDQGDIHTGDHRPRTERTSTDQSFMASPMGEVQQDRRWGRAFSHSTVHTVLYAQCIMIGPLDLGDEKPPPSAIAGRRDTPEAVALLKKNIYHTAPATHHLVPKLRISDAIRAAFEREDHPTKPPQQSASEQQIHTHVMPMHGLRIWQSLITYFMRKSSTKAAHGKKHAVSAFHSTNSKLRPGSSYNASHN
ncbi:hypothetical protein AcW2_006545 [Taiwanofungus camphoratus]|nr:hypothetical protein AcW2_006545 [Antrodia cinnamomea]